MPPASWLPDAVSLAWCPVHSCSMWCGNPSASSSVPGDSNVPDTRSPATPLPRLLHADHVTSPDAVTWRGVVHFLDGCSVTALMLLVLLLQGKTLQAIAIMAAYRAEWPCLIVTPSSLRGAPLKYAHLLRYELSGMIVRPAVVESFCYPPPSSPAAAPGPPYCRTLPHLQTHVLGTKHR